MQDQHGKGLDVLSGRAVILEFVRVGAAVEVRAVDEVTGIEAVAVAPADAARADVERLALRKLAWLLDKRKGEPAEPAPLESAKPKRGWIA
jgi:hypothetical protein